jgi:hypothetical protein
MMKALRYLGRVSASAAGGLLETLVPRRESAAERFFALDDVLVGVQAGRAGALAIGDAHFASSAPTAPGALHRGHRPPRTTA